MKVFILILIGSIAIWLPAVVLMWRYQMVGERDDVVYRLDRWTGAVALCRTWDPDNDVVCVTARELHYPEGYSPKAPAPENKAAR
jgi:hypothetical protein